VQVDNALQQKISRYDALFTVFDIRHATKTEILDFTILVLNLILNLDLVSHFFNVITCDFSKTISCNKPHLNILFSNKNIATLLKVTLTLVQGQEEEIGHNLLHKIFEVCLSLPPIQFALPASSPRLKTAFSRENLLKCESVLSYIRL
jgi:hypothetical protein